jgi:hypothetical protein
MMMVAAPWYPYMPAKPSALACFLQILKDTELDRADLHS